MLEYIIAFLMAMGISYFLTPYVLKFAYKVGAIDIPKDNRRVHTKPMPKLGGLAIFLGVFITTFVFNRIDKLVMDWQMIWVFLGAVVIVITGVFDDIKPLKARSKYLFQVIAALIVYFGGVKITGVGNPFGDGMIELGWLSLPITVFWITGITNTINFIDGLDGLSVGVCGIASLSLFFIASSFVNVSPVYLVVMMMSVILSGACFGFLPHNFNPAKIFAGDTGALFMGFMLSIISIRGALKGPTIMWMIFPVLVLGFPIYDTAFAIYRRLLKKQPISQADKGHIHHRLLNLGLNQRQAVLFLYFITMILGLMGVWMSEQSFLENIAIMCGFAFLVIFSFLRYAKLGKHKKER